MLFNRNSLIATIIFDRAECHSRDLYCPQVVSRRHRFILQWAF